MACSSAASLRRSCSKASYSAANACSTSVISCCLRCTSPCVVEIAFSISDISKRGLNVWSSTETDSCIVSRFITLRSIWHSALNLLTSDNIILRRSRSFLQTFRCFFNSSFARVTSPVRLFTLLAASSRCLSRDATRARRLLRSLPSL